MQRTKLGRSDLEISRILFGSARFHSSVERDRTRVVHAAIDAGVTSLDTAPLYEFGAIEAMLGVALQGRRDSVEILSKVGLRWDDDHGDILFAANDPSGIRRTVRRDSRPSTIRRDVEESLARLRTDRIDLCQIHQPDRLVPFAESLGELGRLREEGKVREIGVSNFSQKEFGEVLSLATDETSPHPIVSNQLHYSLLERSPETEALPLARERGVGVVAYSPLEAGLLAGKLLEAGDSSTPPGDFRLDTPLFRPANAEQINAALLDCALPIAEDHHASLAGVCLAWLLAQPDVSGVIAGASKESHVRAIAEASEINLSTEEVQSLADRFGTIHIDPHAGIAWPRRAKQFARRVGGKIKRTLGRG